MGLLDGLLRRRANEGFKASEWRLPFVEYWDQDVGAINCNALRLSALDPSERAEACRVIGDSVRQSVGEWPDDMMLKAAVSMVDDLYKYMNGTKFNGDVVYEYIDAFGRTFTTALHERGYVIEYVAENAFSNAEFLMLGPFDWFSRVFSAAGFVYICPQKLAFELMCADGMASSDYEHSVSQYIAEARTVGLELLTTCRNDTRHCVFLEADYEDGSLDVPLEDHGDQGVLSVFRNQAPLPGSEVDARFPKVKRKS